MILLFYILTLFFLIVFDLLWLGKIAKHIYRKEVGTLMKKHVFWTPALLFYMLFPLGLIYFAIWPATTALHALLSGALFGLITYGTYNLTNLSLIKGWTTRISIIDIVWGIFLCGTLSYTVFTVTSKFF